MLTLLQFLLKLHCSKKARNKEFIFTLKSRLLFVACFFYTTNLNFLFSKIPQKIITEIENIIDFKRPIPPLDISSGHLKPNNVIIGYMKQGIKQHIKVLVPAGFIKPIYFNNRSLNFNIKSRDKQQIILMERQIVDQDGVE